MTTVTLSEPAYAVGELVPVEQVAAPAALAERLRAYGFATCSVADRPPSELAADAVADLLLRHGLTGGDIDAVVYGTCSHRGEPAGHQGVRGMLDRLGLAAARLYGVWLGESGNLVGALRLARALLTSAGMRTVLVVVADAVPKRPGEYRAMPNAVTINGDGAAACLLSTVRRGPFTVEGIGHCASPAMSAAERGSGLREYLEFMTGVRAALTALHNESGTGPDSYQWLVANNYSASNLSDFADLAGIAHERVFRGTVPRHGHVFTADGLINLAALTDSAKVAPGDRVLVLSTGPFSWGAIGLRRCEN